MICVTAFPQPQHTMLYYLKDLFFEGNETKIYFELETAEDKVESFPLGIHSYFPKAFCSLLFANATESS